RLFQSAGDTAVAAADVEDRTGRRRKRAYDLGDDAIAVLEPVGSVFDGIADVVISFGIGDLLLRPGKPEAAAIEAKVQGDARSLKGGVGGIGDHDGHLAPATRSTADCAQM